jgi:hypothetical protein
VVIINANFTQPSKPAGLSEYAGLLRRGAGNSRADDRERPGIRTGSLLAFIADAIRGVIGCVGKSQPKIFLVPVTATSCVTAS